jgi:branched-chain amino acid transport system substrate-binding protein
MKPIYIIVFVWIFFSTEAFTSSIKSSKEIEKSDKIIKIGLLIQDNKSAEAKYAAEMAINKVNAKGGINGRRLQLIVRSMEGPWGTGSKQAVDLIFNEKVWAIMGSHDGRNAHLVEQACAKTHMVFLSAWACDPTLSQAFVPWYFSCVPNDHQQASALLEEIYSKRKITKIAVVSDNGYDSKLASETFLKLSKKLPIPVPLQLSYDNSSIDFKSLLDQIEKAKVNGIVLFGQPSASTTIIQQIRQRKMKQPVFGSLSVLGENGISGLDLKKYENVVIIFSGLDSDQKRINFQNEFKKEKGRIPGAVATYAFDGMNIIIEAIRNCSFDRDKVQGAMAKTHYQGITGPIQFDDKGNRQGKVGLSEIKNGVLIELKK